MEDSIMTQHMEDIYADEIWRGELTPGDSAHEAAENLKTVSRIWDEMWNLGNFDGLNDVFAASYWGHLPMMDVHGPEQFQQLVLAYRTAYPDVHLTIDDIFGSGDRLAVRWTSRGTHLGAMMGMPPSGNKIEIMGISLFRVEKGKVAEEWEGFDTLKMMQQIGAIPKLG
jgi:steroid delta-isomerase-like uncharacterized protein